MNLISSFNIFGPIVGNDRGIKTQRTIKTKLPLKFCLNHLTIMIDQLGLV